MTSQPSRLAPSALRALDARALDVRALADTDIDALLPESMERIAGRFWTPVAVARRAGQILDELGARRVLDVGSGPGKFCVVAGAEAPRIEFAGVEHRPHLVAVARSLAAHLEIENVRFLVGDATRLSWKAFDAVYVFNSFAENHFQAADRFDSTVELSERRRLDDLARVERSLVTAEHGALFLTYHGLGGPIPAAYDCVHAEAVGTGVLRVWRKGSAREPEQFWLEDGEDIYLMTAREVGYYLLKHIILVDGPPTD